MKNILSFIITFTLLLTSCSTSNLPENNQQNSKNFKVTSVRNISAGDIKAYYEDDPEETFSPPAVDDNDGFLEPDDLDFFIQKLEAITALNLIKNSGFKTKSISPAKELRKTQLLAQMESYERVRLFSDLDTLDSQLYLK